MEHEDLIATKNEVNLLDFLTSDVDICQPVGTLLVQLVCFKDAVEPQQQRETMVEPGIKAQIAGKTL